MEMPTLDYELFTLSGERGWTGTWYAHEDDESMTALTTPYSTRLVDETRVFISTSAPKGITRRWTMRLEGELKPRERDCIFEFGLTVAGRAKVRVHTHVAIYLFTEYCIRSFLWTVNSSLTIGHANAAANPSSAPAQQKPKAASHSAPGPNTVSSSNSATCAPQPTTTKTRW
jgi:beta-glucosidase